MAKTILITGASRGLGKAMVEGFAARGHRIIGCARSEAPLKAMQSQLGENHFFRTVDVASVEEVSRFAKECADQDIIPDTLINSAAIINSPAPLWEISADEFSDLMDVNLKGIHHLISNFFPLMRSRGSGVIVNFSSGWGRSTSSGVAPYCATKWGVEGLTQALAQDLPPGFAAVAFNPGIIDTDMLRCCFGEDASSYGGAEAWAKEAVPFLEALDESDNGASLTCPGQ